MGFLDKIKDFASKNPDKVDMVTGKLGDAFDARTGGKYARQTDTVQQKGGEFLKGRPTPPAPGTTPPAGTTPTDGTDGPA